MARRSREVFRRILLAVALGDALGLPYELTEQPTRIGEDELQKDKIWIKDLVSKEEVYK